MRHIYLVLLMLILSCCLPENESEIIMTTENIDNILVEKAKHKMYLRHGEDIIKAYQIALGKNPIGAKVKSVDSSQKPNDYGVKNRQQG